MRSSQAACAVALAGSPFATLRAGSWHRDVSFVERVYLSMGTLVRFQVYHPDRRAAKAAIGEAASLIQRIHSLMSVQETGSELSRWNRSLRGLDAPFDTLTAAALDEALRFRDLTEGRFDPTVGAAIQAVQAGKAPAPQQDRRGEWDAANRRYRKAAPEVSLDLGGSAKGWAVDRAIDVLEENGVQAALVNAGGDLRVLGAPPGEPAWRIGIRDPRRPDGLLGVVSLREEAVATSGDYEEAGSTLVDPRDLTPAPLHGSVSVIAPTCGAADCLSTALSISPNLNRLLPGTRAILALDRDDVFTLSTSPGLLLEPGDLLSDQ